MSSVITHSKVKIEYEVFGKASASPLLLIQGLGAQMIGWPVNFCQNLASAGFYVILFDNRDVGLSQKFPEDTYSLGDMAIDAAELLEALGICAAHIVGQSMGGMIAQHMANLFPEKMLSLTLFYTCAQNIHIRGAEVLAKREDMPAARSRKEAADMYVIAEQSCGSPAYATDEEHLHKIGGLMWDRGYYPEGVLRQRAAINADPDRRGLLSNVTCPVLILHGDRDQLISDEGARDLQRVMPDAVLHIYPGMGHQLPPDLWEDMITRLKKNAFIENKEL